MLVAVQYSCSEVGEICRVRPLSMFTNNNQATFFFNQLIYINLDIVTWRVCSSILKKYINIDHVDEITKRL